MYSNMRKNVLSTNNLLYYIDLLKKNGNKTVPFRPQTVSTPLLFNIIYTYIVLVLNHQVPVKPQKQYNIGVYNFKW